MLEKQEWSIIFFADGIVFRGTNLSGVKIAAVRFRPAGKRYLEELPLRWTDTTSSEHLPR